LERRAANRKKIGINIHGCAIGTLFKEIQINSSHRGKGSTEAAPLKHLSMYE